MTAQWIVYAV